MKLYTYYGLGNAQVSTLGNPKPPGWAMWGRVVAVKVVAQSHGSHALWALALPEDLRETAETRFSAIFGDWPPAVAPYLWSTALEEAAAERGLLLVSGTGPKGDFVALVRPTGPSKKFPVV